MKRSHMPRIVGASKPPTVTELVDDVSGSEWQPPLLSAQVRRAEADDTARSR